MTSAYNFTLSPVRPRHNAFACGHLQTIRNKLLDNSYDKVFPRVLGTIKQALKRDVALSEETELLADVGMTSLQVMELVFEIEEEFDISFPLNRLPDIRTIKELSQEIVALLNQ